MQLAHAPGTITFVVHVFHMQVGQSLGLITPCIYLNLVVHNSLACHHLVYILCLH